MYAGIPASCSSARPCGKPSRPINTASIGLLGTSAAALTMASHTSSCFTPKGGTKIGTTASIAGSAKNAVSAALYPSGVAEAIISSGLRIEASGGKSGRKRSTVAGESSTNSSPCVSIASAARMPGPPALVSTAVRRERGNALTPKPIAKSKRSSTELARSTPACASIASTAVSFAAKAPVCDEAARAPARDRPDFTTIIGLVLVMRDAISKKCRGFPKFSTYIKITFTDGSVSHRSSRSLLLTSGLLPIDTNCEIPMPYSRA